MSIKTGLLCFVVVLFGFVLVVLVSYAELTERHALDRQLRALMQQKAESVMIRAESVLARAEFTAERTAALLERGGVDSRAGRALEDYLLYQVSSNEHMTGMYVGWSNGDFLYVKRMPGPEDGRFRTLRVDSASAAERVWRDSAFELVVRERDIALEFDPRSRPWYTRTRERGDTVWTEPYLFNISRNPGVTVAAPVMGGGGRLEAVVGVDMDIRLLSDLLADLALPRRSEAVLATSDGRVIATTGELLMGAGPPREDVLPRLAHLADGPLSAALAAGDHAVRDADPAKEGFFPFTWAGAGYHAYFTGAADSMRSWLAGVAVPDRAYLGALRQQRDVYLAAVILLLVAGAFAALVIARSLLRPIQELAGVATDVRERGFGPQPRLRSRFEEINDLSTSLGRLLGRLEERQRENEALNEQLRELNRDLEQQVAVRTEELRGKNAELERLASTDSLTGALNLRAFRRAVEHEIERAARYAGPFSLAVLDIDHFKVINDTHGHGVGDEVLKTVVATGAGRLRGPDVLGRIGGEEFGILLPETTESGAVKTVDRLRDALARASSSGDDGAGPAFSVSIGVAEYVEGDDYHSLTARADRHLYRAKAEGRNRVCSAGERGAG